MTGKSMTFGAILVLFAVPAQVTPASAVPEEIRTACLFEAYEARPRLNAPQIEAYVANCIADFTATPDRRRQR
jgi:hypothetical protein